MAITARELMQPPVFEGLGKFVYCRGASGDWPASFSFEFFGGQMSVEVDESELQNPPAVGAFFFITGNVRRNTRNGTISLAAMEKKFVANDVSALSEEQTQQYVNGLRIRGVGIVKDRQSSQIARGPTYYSAVLEWQGATHRFSGLTPELYQRIPVPGKGVDRVPAYVRFELTMLVRDERNDNGQRIVQQIPSLTWIQLEPLSTGSVAGSSASTPAGSGMSPSKSVSAPSSAPSSATQASKS